MSMYAFPVRMIGCLLLLCLCRCVLMFWFYGACGIGVSDVYMLKSVGDRTSSSGTQFFTWRYVDVLFLNVVFEFVLCV